jgi:hypothetical protein
MKEGRKKENWKRLFVKLEYGTLKVYKNLKVSFCHDIARKFIVSAPTFDFSIPMYTPIYVS